ncbi:MAG: serine/threonine-protein kinase [Planctomycetaceae bacterium]|nr:serine/threonine-protein kinase [Planctomycetaceae bacterium]
MQEMTVDELTQRLLTLDLLTQQDLRGIWASLGTQNIDSETFIQSLMRQGLLTNYQLERLTSGENTGFYFGDYRVLYLVGAGSFARVFRATHRTSGKIVAVKVLRGRFSESREMINQFVHEAELGMELRHPNIVPIYEVVSKDYLHFMVMDFIEGQTLRDYMKTRQNIEPKMATRIVTDICQGLDYAFKRKLQHRDLKLSNVLLSAVGGKAMLVDFGLAALASVEPKKGEMPNQRAIDYAVLERISGGMKKDDPRSDIYFLGCIFYHLLTGVSPLVETRERTKRLDKNRFFQVKPIQIVFPKTPHAVSFVVNKAMSIDVEKRYQSASEMLADLLVASRRLEEGTANDETIAPTQIETGLAAKGNATGQKTRQHTILVVESDPEMQNIFREAFKRVGYRVLILSDPERAVLRVADDDVADLILIDAQFIGPQALLSFNQFVEDKRINHKPAVLLLDEPQHKWAGAAKRDRTHLTIGMPISIKRIREVVAKLLEPEKNGE